MSRDKKFFHFDNIYINQKRLGGHPTVGRSRIPVYKIWELIKNEGFEEAIEEHPTISKEQLEEILEFVDWGVDLGLIEIIFKDDAFYLIYDRSALYQAARLETPPKGNLCLYCRGFVAESSKNKIYVRESNKDKSIKTKDGLSHINCLELSVSDLPIVEVNVYHPNKK